MGKIIRTSTAKERSFTLGTDILKENRGFSPYYIYRFDLREALKNEEISVQYFFRGFTGDTLSSPGAIQQGKTQRGKKFIQIGCKRFVGVNRTKLIRWAKGAK